MRNQAAFNYLLAFMLVIVSRGAHANEVTSPPKKGDSQESQTQKSEILSIIPLIPLKQPVASKILVQVTHITDPNNIPKIGLAGFKAGEEGHAWYGTAVYFNGAESPFTSLAGGSSRIVGGAVLRTELDITGFVHIDHSNWHRVREAIDEKIANFPERFDENGQEKKGYGISSNWFKQQRVIQNRIYWDGLLANVPGAVVKFDGSNGGPGGADSGTIYVLKADPKARVGRTIEIVGQVRKVASQGAGMYAVNKQVIGFTYTIVRASSTITKTIAKSFVPFYEEFQEFKDAGGIQWTFAVVATGAPVAATTVGSTIVRVVESVMRGGFGAAAAIVGFFAFSTPAY